MTAAVSFCRYYRSKREGKTLRGRPWQGRRAGVMVALSYRGLSIQEIKRYIRERKSWRDEVHSRVMHQWYSVLESIWAAEVNHWEISWGMTMEVSCQDDWYQTRTNIFIFDHKKKIYECVCWVWYICVYMCIHTYGYYVPYIKKMLPISFSSMVG